MAWSLTWPVTTIKRGYSRTDTSSLDLAGTFTIMWWQYTNNSVLNTKVLLAKQSTTNQIAYMVQYAADEGHVITLVLNDGTNEMVTTWTLGSMVQDDAWNHIAITYNGSLGAGLKSILYLNSSSQGNGVVTGTEVTAPQNGDGIFAVGRQVDGREGTTQSLESMSLFALEVYNAVLSQATIAARYLLRRVGNESNLQGCWLMGGAKERSELEGTANTTTGNYRLWDRTSNANHLPQNFTTASGPALPYIFDYINGVTVSGIDNFPHVSGTLSYVWVAGGETWDKAEYYNEGGSTLSGVYSSNAYVDHGDAESHGVGIIYSSNSYLEHYNGEFYGDLAFYNATVEPPTDGAEIYTLGVDSCTFYRMRGFDTTLNRLVYWTSAIIDATGDDYSGPGPLTDVIVQKLKD